MDMEQFYTRDKANEGIKVPLTAPDGTDTDHWLLVRGADSDVFRKAEAEAQRKMAVIAADKGNRDSLADVYDEQFHWIKAHLVADWSFDHECTVEAVQEFFKNAPQISDKVNRIAGNRSLFFGKESSNLKSSRARSSSSTASQKGQGKH
jgi:regulator of replication initiation timing